MSRCKYFSRGFSHAEAVHSATSTLLKDFSHPISIKQSINYHGNNFLYEPYLQAGSLWQNSLTTEMQNSMKFSYNGMPKQMLLKVCSCSLNDHEKQFKLFITRKNTGNIGT